MTGTNKPVNKRHGRKEAQPELRLDVVLPVTEKTVIAETEIHVSEP
jgi:hypothetical protein